MADVLGKFMQPKRHSDLPAAPIQPPPAGVPIHPPGYVFDGHRHAGSQPTPNLSTPAVIPTEPAPALSIPVVIPLEPTPNLSIPAVIPLEPAPILRQPVAPPLQPAPPLSIPAVIPEEPSPILSQVHPPRTSEQEPFEGTPPDVHPGKQPNLKLSLTGALPTMTPPALSQPSQVPPMPAPPLSSMVGPPVMPPPPLREPGELPEETPPIIQLPHRPWFSMDLVHSSPPPPHPGKQKIPSSLDTSKHVDDIFNFLYDPDVRKDGNQNTNLDPSKGTWLTEHIKIPNRIPAYLPDLPYFTFSSHEWHGAVVSAAELQRNTLPGFAYETANAAGAAIRSLHLNVGIGPFNVGVGGFGVTTNFNPQQLAKTVRDAALSSVKGIAQGALNAVGNGLTNLINPQFSLTGGGTPTQIPDANDRVQATDYVFTYGLDSRMWLQNVQQREANDNDNLMTRFNHLNDNNYGGLSTVFGGNADRRLVAAFDGNIQSQGGLIRGRDRSGSYRAPLNSFSEEDRTYGNLNNSQEERINEDIIRLSFTDVRSDMTVILKPFINSLTENFAPNWSSQNYFGRVDPVAVYQNTSRTINLSFKLVAFSRDDLEVVYKKLAWLNSMVYPSYKELSYQSGPIIRLRVGSLFNTERGGLSGYITSFNLSYDETTWELDDSAQVPRVISVSMGFQVLHDAAVGLTDDGFGTINSDGTLAGISGFRDMFDRNYLDDHIQPPAATYRVAQGGFIPVQVPELPVPTVNLPFAPTALPQGAGGFSIPDPDNLGAPA